MIAVFLDGLGDVERESRVGCALTTMPQVRLVESRDEAGAILIVKDDPRLVRQSKSFSEYKDKSLILYDGDIMSYYIPSLYASNYKSFFQAGRALTVGHFLSLVAGPGWGRNPWLDAMKDEGGEPHLLYSFVGGATCWTRKRMFKFYERVKKNDVLVRSSNSYRHWDPVQDSSKDEQQKSYVQTIQSSKFVLCPRGASPSSIRLYETMELGRVPVIIADRWIPVKGVDWSFCLFIAERDIGKIDETIRRHEPEWEERASRAKKAYDEHFSKETFGILLEAQIRELIKGRSAVREYILRRVLGVVYVAGHIKAFIRWMLRSAVLSAARMSGKKFPYELNR